MSKDLNFQANLSDELQFLVNCCKTDPSENDIKEILSYIQNLTFNIKNLLALANAHGILPLVHKTLKNLSETDNLNAERLTLNTETLAELKASYMSISQRNILMSAELIRIMKLLEDNGIEALAFKGPTLSQMAYGDITLRQYVDLDILVDEEDLHHAALLLTKHHYIPGIPLSDTLNETFLSIGHDYALFNQKNNVSVELHWTLMRKNHILHFNTFNLWQNKKAVKVNQKIIHTFYTEFLLVYLSVHATKHLWARIEWITDIDRLIRNNDLDWEKVMHLAETLDHLNTLYLCLSLSHDLFQTEIPLRYKNEIEVPSILKSQKLIIDLLNSDFIFNQEGISVQIKKYKLFHLLKGETISTLYAFFYVIFDYSAYDYKTIVKLPKGLNFLYLALRPIHLIGKNFKRYWKN